MFLIEPLADIASLSLSVTDCVDDHEHGVQVGATLFLNQSQYSLLRDSKSQEELQEVSSKITVVRPNDLEDYLAKEQR